MQPSYRMQRAIAPIMAKHNMDLSKVGEYVRLEMPHMDRLVVEVVGVDRVSVAHYYQSNGDSIADPEIVFLILPTGWYPIEITQALVGWSQLSRHVDGTMWETRQRAQADAASFGNVWGRNINDQNWLKFGQLTASRKGE